MTISVVGTPAYADQGSFSTNTPTLSVTVPSGADLLLFSEVINNDNWGQLTGVTVNGSSAGIVQYGTTPSGAANRSARVWGIISPTAGTYNIVWTYTTSSNNGGGLLAMCFTGTDLTTPISASNVSSTGGGSSPLTTTITCASGGVAFAAIYADNQPTPDASQTTVGTNQTGHAFSYKLNATGMTATFTGTPQIAQLVVALNPAAVADTTPPTMTGSMTSSGVTATGFTIDWSGTTRADNVAITGYEYSTDAGTTYTDAGNVTLKAFTGKTASTAYTTLVRAYDAAGNKSTPALSITVTTSASADTTLPTQSGSITSSAITSSGFTMSWPAGSDNVAVTGYEISTDGGTTYASVGNVLTTNVTGKAASTGYACRVRCFDAAGNRSTPALAATITTSAPATFGFLTDAWTNNTGSLWAPGTTVYWDWCLGGRIGALSSITHGTSVLDSASKAPIAGLSAAGTGVLLGAVPVTSAADDNVFYQAATAA